MIQTYIRSIEKPHPLSCDYRGTRIHENSGFRVACNISGSVLIGEILQLKKSEWKVARNDDGAYKWWSLNFHMTVKLEDGKIANIKNPNSFVIL